MTLPKILLLQLLLIPVWGTHSAQAETEDWVEICKNPSTQLDMNECAKREFKITEQELNQTYRAVRTRYKGTLLETRFMDAQLAWLKFRDIDCKFNADRFKRGSIAPLMYSNCKTNLTRQRIDGLKAYLEDSKR